ncbi:BT_2262 family domain-containing protein [uncultured Duncaniella sp.]|uniref:BT_2262 family domain-containing protein n=1 Tax=uncultured Duncaniella sp. TaxID=2768039 RepID=UPI002605FFEC|nr:BT_2262 family domain-containing protein [uncultured Duncaniella sp.]
MKRYISLLAVSLAMVTFTSCDKDTEGLTDITYYPVVELEGPVYELVTAGQAFTDPGCTATLDGVDVTDQIQVTTALNFSNPAPGYYPIVYSVTNADGFSASATRYVLVADPDEPASGFYTVSTDSYRDYNGITYFGGYPLTVVGDGNGNYEISDLLGGWYEYRAGYGSAYALQGDVKIDADGVLTLVDSYLIGWGDSANGITDGKFDASAGTITWNVSYTDYPFNFIVNATKNQ